jgi:hypothetical protein
VKQIIRPICGEEEKNGVSMHTLKIVLNIFKISISFLEKYNCHYRKTEPTGQRGSDQLESRGQATTCQVPTPQLL